MVRIHRKDGTCLENKRGQQDLGRVYAKGIFAVIRFGRLARPMRGPDACSAMGTAYVQGLQNDGDLQTVS